MKKAKKALKEIQLRLKHLFTLNDDPHDLALGFGLGIFLGILPGTGPLAALICAQFLRVNRAAAFFGALLTNTWFSLVVLGLSAHVGAKVMSVDLAQLTHSIQAAFKPFHFSNLFKLSFSQVILPILTGFAIVSISCGILAYIIAFSALHAYRRLKNSRNRPTTP